MAEARRRDEWDQVAMVCKTIADVHRGKDQSPYDLENFHPMHWKPPTPIPARAVVQHMAAAFDDLIKWGQRQ